ncbi:hypothetical protein [Priestia aryabhattai]
MARNRQKPIDVGTTFQLRVSLSEDQVVLDWLRAQSGSFADAVRFLILMDAKMNGIRDYGEILPRNLSNTFIDRFAETSGNIQKSYVSPPEYTPSTTSERPTNVVQNDDERILQSKSYSSMENNPPVETQAETTSVKVQQDAKEGSTLEEKRALLERLKREVGEEEKEVVKEPLSEITNTRGSVTDSITRDEEKTSKKAKAKEKRHSSDVKEKPLEEEKENSVKAVEQGGEKKESSQNDDDPFDLDALAQAWN